MKRDFISLSRQEALHVAIFVEERNARLYRGFARLFAEFGDPDSEEVAGFFREMAEEESRHSSALMRRYMERFGNAACMITESDVNDTIELPQFPDDQIMKRGTMQKDQALEIGLAAEKQAREYYAELVKQTDDLELKDFYGELAEFERDHQEYLERRLARARQQRRGA